MDDVLLGIVLGRLAEFPLPEQAADLLLAALEGDESLAAQLSGQTQPRSAAPAVTTPATPAGAYLQSLTVSGFRGIGPPATLAVSPRPGLTLVVGRNGSGKSSFAEALEVLLTGNLRRWDKLPVVWKQGWRSMHYPDQAEITAEFVVEGAGPARARRTWPAAAAFGGSSASVQVSGERTAADARRRAAALLQPTPDVLMAATALPGIDTAPARAAWQRWTSLPDAGTAAGPAGLRAMADHLSQELASLTREIHDLSALASAEVARRDDKWAPVAGEVTSWCANAVKALDGMAPVNMIKAADKWLKGATDAIRNERLAPLAEQAGVRPRTRWAQWPVPALGR